MRSASTPALLLLILLAAGGKVSADVGTGSTVVQTVISLWKVRVRHPLMLRSATVPAASVASSGPLY